MAAYCTEDDLLTGKMPLPPSINAQQRIRDAADEINSKIGFVYQIPVVFEPNSPAVGALLLKRANAHLASGRIIMAMDAGGQNNSLHRYGSYLIRQAELIIDGIVNGTTPLEGAPPAGGWVDTQRGPLISNVDKESKVEGFYDRFRYRGPQGYYRGV